MEEFVIPEDYPEIYNPKEVNLAIQALEARHEHIRKTGMFAYVCAKWVKPLSRWIGSRKCLEIMAGTGYLSLALRGYGVNIIATDDNSWGISRDSRTVLHPIEIEAKEAIESYRNEVDIVIVSWPPMNNDIHEAMLQWPKNKHIIYIGEWGGCTGCEEFTQHFIEDYDSTFQQIAKLYKPWFGIHDGLYLGKYK